MDTNYFIFLGAIMFFLVIMGAYATYHDKMHAIDEE